MAAESTDIETRIEILLKLAVIPDVTILDPRISVEDGTVTLGGTVDALWKRTYIENIMASELHGRRIRNNLTVALGRFAEAWRQAFPEKEREVRRPEMRISRLEGDRSM
jgi:hypothetical protein